jgi:pyruvate formate lyase activating enzyme
MNGFIFDIRRFSVNDGPGIRTTVFFKGCPLSCWWCHNPEGRSCEIQKAKKVDRIGDKTFIIDEVIGKEINAEEVMNEVDKDSIIYEESGGGVTFSGGEPLLQIEFLKSLLSESHKKYYHNVVDTSGYTHRNNLISILDLVDLFLYDIKIMDDEEHKKYTGVSNKIIFENLEYLLNQNKNVIIRFPVIPGVSDTQININLLLDYIQSYDGSLNEIHLLPYHNIASNKYQKLNMENRINDIPSLYDNDILPIKKVFETAGIKVKIGG